MQGPDDDFRAYVHARTSEAMEADDEGLIEDLLAEIEDRMRADLDNNVAGWGQKAAARLRWIAGVLANVLNGVKNALGASGYSISVGFPWGISIGIDW